MALMNILITGGAGYIGSHVVKALKNTPHNLFIYDNLSTGHRQAVTSGELIEGDLEEEAKLDALFKDKKFNAVLHFAGSIVVSESVREPLKYYFNNTVNSHRLITLCKKYGVKNFIFSSTAAVYGIPENGLCTEESPLAPINPYGESKLMTEKILRDFSASSDFRYVAIRYFNVAGADPEGEVGQSRPEATHLVNIASEVATGKREKLEVFGTDYNTPDGTCVRDYIHVSDLADAHVKALDYLIAGGESEVINCGYGKGFSVAEVVKRVQEVTEVNFKVVESPKRPGDPDILISQAEKIKSLLGWEPKYNDLDVIIRTAYEWEKNRKY